MSVLEACSSLPVKPALPRPGEALGEPSPQVIADEVRVEGGGGYVHVAEDILDVTLARTSLPESVAGGVTQAMNMDIRQPRSSCNPNSATTWPDPILRSGTSSANPTTGCPFAPHGTPGNTNCCSIWNASSVRYTTWPRIPYCQRDQRSVCDRRRIHPLSAFQPDRHRTAAGR